MVHILLLILKIIGIVLVVLLALLLLLISAVLFVPVRYRGKIFKPAEGLDKLEAGGRIFWMFRILTLEALYENGRFYGVFKVFGISVRRFGGQQKADNLPVEKRGEDKNRQKGEPGQEEYERTEAGEKIQEPVRSDTVSGAEPEHPERIRRIFKIPQRIAKMAERVRKKLIRLKNSFRYWKKFLTSEPFREGMKLLLTELRGVFRAIRPRKVKGELVFGFDDPALTGQTLGVVSLYPPALTGEFKVVPVFEQKILRMNMEFTGRFYGITLVRAFWRLFRDRNIRFIYRKFHSGSEG